MRYGKRTLKLASKLHALALAAQTQGIDYDGSVANEVSRLTNDAALAELKKLGFHLAECCTPHRCIEAAWRHTHGDDLPF